MDFEWDEAKDAVNRNKHGIGFKLSADFDWETAAILNRSRHADGEPRFAAVGPVEGRLFTIIYTWRGDARRLISARRSNSNERKAYEQIRA